MAFIHVHNKIFDNNNNIVGGTASIMKSFYIKDNSYHSKQETIERLGKVVFLSPDGKSGIFESPIRGLVEYDVITDTFTNVDINDDRIKDKNITISSMVHTIFGDSYLLLEFLNKHNLLNIFRELFIDDNDYERFLSHLCYDILKDGSHVSCDNFITRSFLSYLIPDLGIPSLKCDSRFFKIMSNDKLKLDFFKKFIKHMRNKYPNFGKATYVDSTPLPNDISNNPFNALCSHGIGQVSIQMRLVLILDQETGLPVWFEIIPGNILDINTLNQVTEDVLVSLDIKINSYVLDAGYVSKDIIQAFSIGTNQTIIARMPAKKGYPHKELYKNTKELFHKGKYQFKRKDYTYFGIQRNIKIFESNIYEYVYLDHYNATKGFNNYLENHEEDYEKMNEKDKDYQMVKDGYFVLVSNQNKTPKEILEEYYCRTDIEKVFKTAKEYLKLMPLNKWNEDAVRGKIFTDMISTIVYLLIRRDLKDEEISISDMIGCTQSLMCFRNNNGMVNVECANKKVKECYKALCIDIPNRLDTKEYINKTLMIKM